MAQLMVPQKQLLTARLLASVLILNVGLSFQYGFYTGFVNNAQDSVRTYFEDTGALTVGDDLYFTEMWSIVVSCFAIGGVIGTFGMPPITDRIGRNKSLMLCSVPIMACAILTGLAKSLWWLIVARLLVGLGLGGGVVVVSMYINEISPAAIRGALGTSTQLLITIGIAGSQALSTRVFNLLGTPKLWKYMMLFPVSCTVLLVVGLCFIPETPSFLLKTQGVEAARRALKFYRSGFDDAEIEEELDGLRKEAELGQGKGNVGFREVWGDKTGELWKPIVIGMFVNLSMQLSGIDAVFFYSSMVFEEAGMSTDMSQVWTTAVGVVNVLVTIPAMLYMDKLGRKYILATGLGGMCVSFVAITFSMVNGYHMAAVYSMISIIIFFAFGPGCIGWFIVAELNPVHARGFASALGFGTNWFANWTVGYVFPYLLMLLGNWTFIVFMVSTGLLTCFTLACVPETMGLKPHEVAALFAPKGAANEPLLKN